MKFIGAIVLGLLMLCLVGLAEASDIEDIVDVYNKIDDAKDALEIANEGREMVQEQLEDPTNAALLRENLEETLTKPLDIAFGGDIHDNEGVKRSIYAYVVIIITVSIFSTFILPFIKR